MASADGQLIISFNGEIYNYRALRAQLERKGYVSGQGLVEGQRCRYKT